jgi:serine/threonine-protein kinase
MGVVYLAQPEGGGPPIALKTILPAVRPPRLALARFLREAEVLMQLRHPHIVSFRDLGHADNRLYFAMDFVEGRDAAALVKEEGPLEVARAVRLACQLLGALEYAHGRGFVHRDIKPGNLLVAPAGGPAGEAVQLADFGLARAYQASQLSGLTLTGAPGGTPAFMPPEQVTNFRGAQPAADLYSTAATLYFLLTGLLVYDEAGSTLDLYLKILKEDPVPVRSRRPDLPEGLAAVVHQALARNPQARFADAAAFRTALTPFAGG